MLGNGLISGSTNRPVKSNSVIVGKALIDGKTHDLISAY